MATAAAAGYSPLQQSSGAHTKSPLKLSSQAAAAAAAQRKRSRKLFKEDDDLSQLNPSQPKPPRRRKEPTELVKVSREAECFFETCR